MFKKKDSVTAQGGTCNDDGVCHGERDNVDALEKKCGEYLAGWKRALADYQNLLKDSGREKQELVRFANENLILRILPILDNFKLALKDCSPRTTETAMTENAWIVGFSHIKKQLEDLLAENGVEEIKTIGEKFDPLLHEAVEKSGGGEGVDERIIEERRPGYRLNGKVIQAARVVIGQ